MKQKKRCCNYKPHRHAHLVRCDLSKYESHHHPHYRSFDIQFLFSCILQNINKIPLLLSSKYGIYILSDSYFTIYFSSLSRGCTSEITFRYVTSADPLTVICTLFTV